jgi:hypothetical protein
VDGRCGERGIWLCKGPGRRCCCCWLNAERWTHLPYQPRLLLWWQRMACFGHRLIIYQLYWSSPTDHANHPSARFQSFSLLLHFYTFSYNVYFSHLPNCFRLSTIGELHLINNIKAVGSFYSFVVGVHQHCCVWGIFAGNRTTLHLRWVVFLCKYPICWCKYDHMIWID